MNATGCLVRQVDEVPPRRVCPVPPSGFARLRQLVTRTPGPALQGLLAFVVYLVAFVTTAGMPLISHLNAPNLRQYWTDVQFYAWSLGWWPYAVSHGINPLFSNQIGAPHDYDLAWASTAPSVDLVMWPVTAAFGVVVSYNVVLLLIPPVSAWAAFVAARRLTGRFRAALLAGAVYGFCPYELQHTWQGQPNLTVIALFPLIVYLVLRWWDGTLGRTWFVTWMALVMAVQFYTFNEAFAEMTVVGAGALLIGFAVARPRRLAQGGATGRADRSRVRGGHDLVGAVPAVLAEALPGRAHQTRAGLLPAADPPDRADVAADVRRHPVDQLLRPHRPGRDRKLRRHPADHHRLGAGRPYLARSAQPAAAHCVRVRDPGYGRA